MSALEVPRPTTEEINASVDAFLEANHVKYGVSHAALLTDDQKWEHDLWIVTLTKLTVWEKPGARITLEYRTGIGNRKVPPKPSYTWALYKRALVENHRSRHDQIFREYAKPVRPAAASVLHCYAFDAMALDMSFKVWCNEFGYDDDSISAFETYRACCEAGTNLAKIFDHTQLAQLREMVMEY